MLTYAAPLSKLLVEVSAALQESAQLAACAPTDNLIEGECFVGLPPCPTCAVCPTEAPTTEAPTTEAATTEAPTTEAATEAPTTEAATTEAATTEAATTEAATTEAATTVPEPVKH